MKTVHIITGALLCVLFPAPTDSFPVGTSRLDRIPESSTDNVECFLDYMELWVPRRQMDGLLLWLSRVMRFPVSLSSLDRSNHLISRCRYALHTDSNGNYIFRVHYAACGVQTQEWILLFRGELVVSVEDSSLIGVEVKMNNSSVTVKGPRDQLLSPKELLYRQTELLPLWIGHGLYAYSLEASCPLVTRSPGEEVTVHIPKQRMGLVKRGSYITESLTLRNIVAGRLITITVTENKHFVMVNVPAGDIVQSQNCTTPDNQQGVQAFYRIDLVLEFTEIPCPMNWTLENYYECTVLNPDTVQQETLHRSTENPQSANVIRNVTVTEKDDAVQSNGEYPLTLDPDVDRLTITISTMQTKKATTDSVKPTLLLFTQGSGEHLDVDLSGSGDYPEMVPHKINETYLADLQSIMINSSKCSMTLVTKLPNVLQLLSSAPYKHSKISNDYLSNSTMMDVQKGLRELSNNSSNLTLSTFSSEIVGTNKTSSLNTSDDEELSSSMVHSVGTNVTERGGSRSPSSIDKQEDSTKPRNVQQISDVRRPKDDADPWEMLIGDTLHELLDGTTRDELIAPVYGRYPSRRSESGSSEKEKLLKNTQEETMDETSIRPQKRPVGEKVTRSQQHMARDSVLSSRHIDWLILNGLHGDMLYNTSSETENISSVELLIVGK